MIRALRSSISNQSVPSKPDSMARISGRCASVSFSSSATSISESDILEFCQGDNREFVPHDRLIELSNFVTSSRPDLAPDLLLSLANPRVFDGQCLRRLTLCACDRAELIESTRLLLHLSEFSTSKLSPADFSLLSSVVRRASSIIDSFSPSEFTGLISVCARTDFADSDFNEAVQQHLPRMLPVFSDNQLPVVFGSVLRLGIDQPVDRVPVVSDEKLPPQSSPLMVSLVAEIVSRVSTISEAGCLAMLHAIVRRPRGKITPEMETLVHAVSENSRIDEWGPSLRIQAVHTLSRLGIENDKAIASLFRSIDHETVTRVPSANLQHLLSIVHNHAERHEEGVWRPVLNLTVDRIGEPIIARSMQMPTIAVTIGYLGRLRVHNRQVVNTLLHVFCGKNIQGRKLPQVSSKPLVDRITAKMVSRILTDGQVDIAHLTSVCEALDRLQMWELPLAAPLALITRRIIFRDGLHNVKAAPLSLITACFIRNSFALTDTDVAEIDSHIDMLIDSVASEGRVSTNWCLQSTGEFDNSDWRRNTVVALMEGLLKHEQYIRSTDSAVRRCLELKQLIANENWIQWNTLPDNVCSFIDSLTLEPVDG